MAKELGVQNLTVTKEQRTYRVEVMSPKNADPTLRYFREEVTFDEKGNILSQTSVGVLERKLSEIASTQFTSNDKTYTGLELAQLVADLGDQFASEDADKKAMLLTLANPTP